MSIVLSLSSYFIITFFSIETANEIKVKKKTQERKTNTIVGFHALGRSVGFQACCIFLHHSGGKQNISLDREISKSKIETCRYTFSGRNK